MLNAVVVMHAHSVELLKLPLKVPTNFKFVVGVIVTLVFT